MYVDDIAVAFLVFNSRYSAGLQLYLSVTSIEECPFCLGSISQCSLGPKPHGYQ
jgi:hypothetical protein